MFSASYNDVLNAMLDVV